MNSNSISDYNVSNMQAIQFLGKPIPTAQTGTFALKKAAIVGMSYFFKCAQCDKQILFKHNVAEITRVKCQYCGADVLIRVINVKKTQIPKGNNNVQQPMPQQHIPQQMGPQPQQTSQRMAYPQQPMQSQTPPQQAPQRQAPPQQPMQRQVPPQQPMQRQAPPQQPMQRQAYPQQNPQRMAPPQQNPQRMAPPQQNPQRMAPPQQNPQRMAPPQQNPQRMAPPQQTAGQGMRQQPYQQQPRQQQYYPPQQPQQNPVQYPQTQGNQTPQRQTPYRGQSPVQQNPYQQQPVGNNQSGTHIHTTILTPNARQETGMLIWGGFMSKKKYVLQEGENWIGRFDNVKTSNVMVHDDFMSRRSACIEVTSQKGTYSFKFTVYKTLNPVKVNGRELACNQSVYLNYEDYISMGKTTFFFKKLKR